jgi:hypothetical protein
MTMTFLAPHFAVKISFLPCQEENTQNMPMKEAILTPEINFWPSRKMSLPVS